MACAYSLRLLRRNFFVTTAAVVAAILFLASNGAAQAAEANPAPFSPDDFKKYSGLFSEFGQMLKKFQDRVHYPEPRNQSRLLPLLPQSTILLAAVPNYGEASHQALVIFQQERKENAELRSWWERGDMVTEGPKAEEALEKFYQLSQYLGDEFVVAGVMEGKKDPDFVFLAEVQKPGLKSFLQQMLAETAGKAQPAARVLDLQELATAKDTHAGQPVILIRPDFVIGAADLGALRRFSALIDLKDGKFAGTGFGQRLAQSYEGGATMVAGLDVHAILAQIPSSDPSRATLERTGFSDMKYLVWEHKKIDAQAASQLELSFTGPRRAVASWLATPGPMGSLDFISPKAVVATSLRLKDPAQIFDDVRDIATAQNPNAFAAVTQVESAMKINLRNDLFARLGGEIAVEMDRLTPTPEWKVILKAEDPSGLLATLRTFMTQARMTPVEADEDGVTYHTIQIPVGPRMQEICFAVVDGYFIVASGHEAVAESVRLHRSGESLAKSTKFNASLPPGSLAQTSAVFYEDPLAVAALSMRQVSPDLADSFSKAGVNSSPAVIAGYGDESALREASRSGGMDFGAALVVGAIAIPNLLRARMAANESSAVATLRTANTAEITYAASYPVKGFARDFASLGPDPSGSHSYSAQHAGIIDAALGNPGCTAGAWCVRSGYRFSISATCRTQRCSNYVVVGTPISNSTGIRSFCSTSDAVIRVKTGTPLVTPVSAAECGTWDPLQ